MGDAAEKTDDVVVDDGTDTSQNPDPMLFSVGEEETPESKDETPAETAETPDFSKQLEELKAKNEDLQKQLNRKFFNLRKERKAKPEEDTKSPSSPTPRCSRSLKNTGTTPR